MASLEQDSSLPRLPLTAEGPGIDRRRDARSDVSADAEIEAGPDTLARLRIAGLSIHGCEVRDAPDDIHVGQFIEIRLSGFPKITGFVRWARDGSAGVEFAHAIPERVVREQEMARQTAGISQI